MENGNVKYINNHDIQGVHLDTYIEYYSNTPKAYIGVYTWYECGDDNDKQVEAQNAKVLAEQVESKNIEIAKLRLVAKNLLEKIDELESPSEEITPNAV